MAEGETPIWSASARMLPTGGAAGAPEAGGARTLSEFMYPADAYTVSAATSSACSTPPVTVSPPEAVIRLVALIEPVEVRVAAVTVPELVEMFPVDTSVAAVIVPVVVEMFPVELMPPEPILAFPAVTSIEVLDS
jgi:hypothetical protein